MMLDSFKGFDENENLPQHIVRVYESKFDIEVIFLFSLVGRARKWKSIAMNLIHTDWQDEVSSIETGIITSFITQPSAECTRAQKAMSVNQHNDHFAARAQADVTAPAATAILNFDATLRLTWLLIMGYYERVNDLEIVLLIVTYTDIYLSNEITFYTYLFYT